MGRTLIENSKGKYYSEGNYKYQLKNLIEGCKPAEKKLARAAYKRKTLTEVVSLYNACQSEALYTYHNPPNTLSYGIRAGIFPAVLKIAPGVFSVPAITQSGLAYAFGLYIQEQTDDIDPSLSARAEILYNYQNFKIDYLAVPYQFYYENLLLPLIIQYQLLKRKVSPYIMGGVYLSFHLNSGFTSDNKTRFLLDFVNSYQQNTSGSLLGAGIRWKTSRQEFGLEYRHQKVKLSRQSPYYMFTQNMVTLSVGLIKKRK
jgi:hypothetical protein